MTEQQELDLAIKLRNIRWEKPDIKLSMKSYSYRMSYQTPQSYGVNLQKKIIEDSRGLLKPTNQKRGDAVLNTKNGKLYYEIKTTYLNQTGVYNITHIRLEQKYDYFIICLYDSNNDYLGRYYVLPKSFITNGPFKLSAMNGNKESNKNNETIEMRFTIQPKDAYRLFGENNLLDGTSYNDLMSYYFLNGIDTISIENSNMMKPEMVIPMTAEIKSIKPIKSKSRTYKPMIRVHFEVDGNIIQENTNRKTILNLIRYIGPEEATKYFPNSWLTKNPGIYHTLNVGDGYYLNPKLSIRDIRYCLRRGEKSVTKNNIKLFEN